MRSDIDLRYQSLWEEADIFELPVLETGLPVNTDIIIPFGNLFLSPMSLDVAIFSNSRFPASKDLVLSTNAPIVGVFPNFVPSQNLLLSSTAPTVTKSILISPASADLSLSTVAPIIPIQLVPSSGNLLLSPAAPSISPTSSLRNPAAGNLILSTLPPTVVTTTVGLTAPVITTLRPYAAT